MRAQAAADVAYMYEHLAMDGGVSMATRGKAEREAERDRLMNFPLMPDHVRLELEQIIQLYGLPLATLTPSVAQFILRRVMFEYRSTISKKRTTRTPLFTKEELRELLTVMGLEPMDLAEMLANGTRSKSSIYQSINRWMTDEGRPTNSGAALRINAMIQRRVRQKYASESGSRISSTNPDTARRRAQWNRQKVAKNIPLAPSAKEALDAAQNSSLGSPGPKGRGRRGSIRTVQKGGGVTAVRRDLPQRKGGLERGGEYVDLGADEPDRDGGRGA